MSVENNKAIVRRFYHELVNHGRLELADDLMSSEYVEYGNPSNSGIDGFKEFVTRLSGAFPDLRVSIEDLIAEGDKVVARVMVYATHRGTFMGSIAPTGTKVSFSGIDIFRIADGKILGRWNQRDLLGLMTQLGVDSLPK